MKKIIILGLTLLLFYSSFSQQTKRNKETIQNFYAAFNARNFTTFYSYFNDSVLVHFSNNKNFTITPNEIRSSIDPQIKAFPDVSDTVSFILAEGEWVSICVRHTGTNSDSLWGLPPSKRVISYNVMEMYRLKNNKIVEIYVVQDHLSMYQQMGIIPFRITKSLVLKN